MNVEHTKKLFDDFPRLYAEFDDFECGDEYFEIIYKLSSELCRLANQSDYEPEGLFFDEGDGIYPRVTQVKIKCGGLRFYAYALSKEMQTLIFSVEGS